MEPAKRFSDRVENYIKYRPSYPAEMLELFRNEMNLSKDSVVADIGSGTGISSKIFLECGASLYGIEPNRAMREAADRLLADFENFHSIAGSAEATSLPKNSIDIIVAAQAFHWFDQKKAIVEFRRIIRPGGFIALIWNERSLDASAFLKDYEALLIEFGTDYQNIRHDNISARELEGFLGGDFRSASFANLQTFDFAGLKGRLLSSSYAPNEAHPRYPAMIEKLKSLFALHQKDDTIEFLYRTNVFYNKF